MNNDSQVIIYQTSDGKAKLQVKFEGETAWLSQAQMAELFETTKQNISLHVGNIYKESELTRETTVKDYLTVQTEGGVEKKRSVEYFNLDVIISVGYRVKSIQGTQFRIWATKVLREHIVKGITVNQQRIQQLEQKQLAELREAVALVKRVQQKALSGDEAKGLLDVITT